MANIITGAVVGYQVKSQLVDMIVDAETVKNTAEASGLDSNLVYVPTKKMATSRAVNETAKTNRRFKDHLARKVTDGEEKAVYALVDENRDAESEENSYQQTTTIKYDKETKEVSCHGDSKMVERFNQEYEKFSVGLTSNDIRCYVYRVLRETCNGVGLIPTGGLYFVPESSLATIEALDSMLIKLGIGRLWYEPKIDCKQTREWVWDSAQTEIQNRVNQIMSSVANIHKRQSSLHKRNAELEGQGKLLKAYADLTGYGSEAEIILETINDATNQVSNKIAEIASSK